LEIFWSEPLHRQVGSIGLAPGARKNSAGFGAASSRLGTSLAAGHPFPEKIAAKQQIDDQGSMLYDHNFRRFWPIFGDKIGVFLKKHCYDQIFARTSCS
jgi:hypothetical protein